MSDILGLMEESDEKKADENVGGKALAVRAENIIDKIKTREIKNGEENENMAGFLKEVKSALKGLDNYWDPDIKKARLTAEGLRAKKKADTEPLLKAEVIAKDKMKVFRLAEEEKKRKAEAERWAEQKRLQDEADLKAKDEQEHEQAKEDALAQEEGRAPELVEINTPDVVEVLPKVVQESPKVSGISFAEHWIWECTDFSKVPDAYKKLDEVKINGYVRSMKGDSNIPGIRPYDDKTLKTKV